ncbi:MAG: SDR family NAD(P)-dependent oxidoreductase, partial [Sphaerochaetaceae bacterium]
MQRKNILITGATSGIGLASLHLFATKGWNVWGVSRRGKIEGEKPSNVHLYSLDVTNQGQVEETVKKINSEAQKLTGKGIQVILHCAGFGIAGAAEDTPLEAVYQQFETNYFGVLRVNAALLPLMRSEEDSLVILLGSVGGKISLPFQSHYSATKFALEAYSDALRMEGIKATIVEAGDTKTPFTAQRKVAIPPNSPYSEQGARAIKKMSADEQGGYPPLKVARVIYKLA